MGNELITVGIPAYHAKECILDALASVQIQTIKDKVKVIIASDDPKENYGYLKKLYPRLKIKTLGCTKNTGPGLARQRILDACETDWITFLDADDVFCSPLALERLLAGILDENIVRVQGRFFEELQRVEGQDLITGDRYTDQHPWVFGRLYRVSFLKEFNIGFSSLRAMEDGEFNWKIDTVLNSPGIIYDYSKGDYPIYLWRNTEGSITRIGREDNKGYPQYTLDHAGTGEVDAVISLFEFAEDYPLSPVPTQALYSNIVSLYLNYIKCIYLESEFTEQNFFNAKKLYHECFLKYELEIDEALLSDVYINIMNEQKTELPFIPDISFKQFLTTVKNAPYGGEEEQKEIRSRLSEKAIENNRKVGFEN